jgi:hypothetical protein
MELLSSRGLLECNVQTIDHRMDEESTRRMFIPPGISSSETRNPPEEWDYAGNYQLIDEESARGRGFHRELPAHLRKFRPVRSKCAENPPSDNNSSKGSSKFSILPMPTLKKKFIHENLIKMKKEPDPALLGTSYLSILNKTKGQQNLGRLSL